MSKGRADRERTLILHVGLPKTATTALQTWLQSNRSALREHGVAYPYLPRIGDEKHHFVVPALRLRKLDQIASVLAAETAPVVVLSNEGLTNHFYDFDPDALDDFRELTQGMRTEIVLVTRQRHDWLKSYYRQCVINPNNGASDLWGTTLTFEEFPAHIRVQRLLDHVSLTRDMRHGYGADRVIHLEYEDDWFSSVLTHLGVDAGEWPLPPRVNQSLPNWAIELVRQLNAIGLPRASRSAWLQALSAYLGAGVSDLETEVRAMLDPHLIERIAEAGEFSRASGDATPMTNFAAFVGDLRAQA